MYFFMQSKMMSDEKQIIINIFYIVILKNLNKIAILVYRSMVDLQ